MARTNNTNPSPTDGQPTPPAADGSGTDTTIATTAAPPVGTPAPTGRPTVRVRVKSGRILVQRRRIFDDAVDERGKIVGKVQVGTEDVYKNQGEIFDMDAEEAAKLLKRSFEGYPSLDGQPGKQPGIVSDSPIELVPVAA